MRLLEHISLTTTKVQQQYARVRGYLAAGDFAAAQVKKLRNGAFYRAKLGDAHRLLFKLATYQGEPVVLVLEVILNHNYEDSRFLRGGIVKEEDFVAVDTSSKQEGEEQLRYLNPSSTTFHLLDKPVSFNPEQEDIFLAPMPLILVGSAGSGKTVLTLEKLRLLSGRVLYVSLSQFLVENARRLFSLTGNQDESEVDFLSFSELLGTIQIPAGREINYQDFAAWCSRQSGWAKKHARKVFEEFRGVLSGGGSADGSTLERDEYLQLGVKQSIFLPQDRPQVFDLFRRYLAWLPQTELFDSTILAHEYMPAATPTYDSVVVDEVQDLTVPQLALILRMSKNPHNFILCGDSNQIVHPNFFSWSRVKSFFFTQDDDFAPRIIRVLRANFRNAKSITNTANTLLALKQRRFGSIDKESNFLVESVADEEGSIALVAAESPAVQKLNQASRLSTNFAVIVLDDGDKERARKIFETPLIFSVHEAKGLEYATVILFSFVVSALPEFTEIVGDLTCGDLVGDLTFARARDKSDKSLEIYKFFVNALYVGITRALRSVFIVDEAVTHNLWQVLQVPHAGDDLTPKAESSSAEEWSKEARRLELQGKLEQAREIREKILKVEKVPWATPTLESLTAAMKEAANSSADISKKRLIELFELGEAQSLPMLHRYINRRDNAPTKNEAKARELMITKHYDRYGPTDARGIRANLRRYGINHQNPLGETPLLIAARLCKPRIVEELLQEGADPSLTTLGGLSPLRGLIREVLVTEKLSRRQAEDAGETWQLLATPLSLNIQGRLVKILPHHGEYLLLQLLATIIISQFTSSMGHAAQFGISLKDIYPLVRKFPTTILPERRQSQDYTSSLFSKNEVSKDSPHNRMLFVRGRRGYYLLNPLIRLNEHPALQPSTSARCVAPEAATPPAEWRPIYEILGLNLLNIIPNHWTPSIATRIADHSDYAKARLAERFASTKSDSTQGVANM